MMLGRTRRISNRTSGKTFFLKIIRISRVCVALDSLSANSTKWLNTLKQFVGNLPTNSLSVFDHYVKLTRKGLKQFGATVT